MGNNKIIGAKIKSIRESKQLTVEEVAERSGLSTEQIERIEGNVDFPSLAPLIKIARVLGVRLGTFLDDNPNSARLSAAKRIVMTPIASVLPTIRWKTANIWNTIHCRRINPAAIWNRS